MTQINFNYMPDNPKSHYRNKNWKGWRNFYGNDYLSFEETRKFVKKLRLKNKREWRKYCRSGNKPNNIPYSPDKIYENEWISWGDFLGTGTIYYKNIIFLSFKEARIFVRKLKLKNLKEWKEYCKSGNKPNNIPSNPNLYYKDEWISLGDFLGTGTISNQNKIFLSFEEARKFVRKLGLKNKREWEEYSKSGNKPNNIPSYPYQTYKNKWISYGDFLGTGFLPFEEAKKFARKLRLKNKREWEEYSKSGNKPNNIPSSPNIIYKDEWISWYNFLGGKNDTN